MLTKAEILKEYETFSPSGDPDDLFIKSPGKFEGEPIYVPYFYDLYLDGMADIDEGDSIIFTISAEDRQEFPTLHDVTKLGLDIDDNGFVNHWAR